MRSVMSGGIAVALVLGMALGTQAEDKSEGEPRSRPTWGGSWFGGDRKDKAEGKPLTPAEGKPIVNPTSEVELSQRLQRERTAFLRRIEVCNRLLEIADSTNNAELRRQAEQLERRCWDVFQQRTGVIGSDEVTLERKLGGTSNNALLTDDTALPSRGARAGLQGGLER